MQKARKLLSRDCLRPDVAATCVFRPAILATLGEHNLTWRTVFENGSMEATVATMRADLAVSAWLASTIPPDLDILPAGLDLPDLPNFGVSLHVPRHQTGAATELACYIQDDIVRRWHAEINPDGLMTGVVQNPSFLGYTWRAEMAGL